VSCGCHENDVLTHWGSKEHSPNSLAGFNGPLCGGGEGNMEGREKESDRREHHSKIKF